jgi:rfaE bifunctional protein nucleotidyltransferase chain/domain
MTLLSLAEAKRMAGPNCPIALCHGCFDVIHPGHIEHLYQARNIVGSSGYLYVGITSDRFINKGPGRPIFTQEQRAAVLSALSMIDGVIIVDSASAIPAIEVLQPAFYIKGPDYAEGLDDAGNLEAECRAVELNGGQVAFTAGDKYSSSEIVDRVRQVNRVGVSSDAVRYLRSCYWKLTPDVVIRYINLAKDLSVQLIGEPILDRYVYVTPAGKSAKDNTITYIGEEVQSFQGGIDAIAGHLYDYVGNYEIVQPFHSIVKTRYVQREFMHKIFSHVASPKVLSPLDLPRLQPTGDFTLVADFGHGLIPTSFVARAIWQKSKWLALTVQANSLNYGFNLLTKYPSAHYVVADELEVRLACGDSYNDIHELTRYLTDKLGCQMFAVTRGPLGALIYDGTDFEEVPALAEKVVDRMGAGDAFLAWTAPLVFLGAPKEVVGLVGSIASALKVERVGNEAVTKEQVLERLDSLLL